MKLTKLVVHIGHGKTGSSSIQKTLVEGGPGLARQNIRYLGIMLEYAQNTAKPKWQFPEGSDIFFSPQKADERAREIYPILKEELEVLAKQGVKTAIWSNEWILERYAYIIPALQRLRSEGHEVHLQCYVRHPDKWAQSAYSQWGLKHKSYPGEIRPFGKWRSVFGSSFKVYPDVKQWADCFGSDFHLFNFDEAGNVVAHFLKANSVQDLNVVNENITPSPEIIAAQAVFNNRSYDPVWPQSFDPFLNFLQKHDPAGVKTPELGDLMPSRDELAQLVEESSDDILKVNSILEASGEPRLSFSSPPKQIDQPTSWEMEQFLLKAVFALFQQVTHLQNELNKVKKETME